MSGGEQRQRRTAVLNNSAYWLGQMDDGAASSKLLDDPDFSSPLRTSGLFVNATSRSEGTSWIISVTHGFSDRASHQTA